MTKEPADNCLQPEKRIDMSKWEARLALYGISAAMTSMAIINSEVMKARDDAIKVLEDDKEDETKPPKPPRRPNSPARLALGNT
jgi:hypothetical protein